MPRLPHRWVNRGVVVEGHGDEESASFNGGEDGLVFYFSEFIHRWSSFGLSSVMVPWRSIACSITEARCGSAVQRRGGGS